MVLILRGYQGNALRFRKEDAVPRILIYNHILKKRKSPSPKPPSKPPRVATVPKPPAKPPPSKKFETIGPLPDSNPRPQQTSNSTSTCAHACARVRYPIQLLVTIPRISEKYIPQNSSNYQRKWLELSKLQAATHHMFSSQNCTLRVKNRPFVVN